MSEYPPHVCQYNCGRSFQSLHDLIVHVEARHIDFDADTIEKLENEQPACIPFSYVLRYSTEAEVAEYAAKNVAEESLSGASNLVSIKDETETVNLMRTSTITKPQIVEAPQNVRKYSCPVIGCSKTYKNQYGMKYHVANAHDMKTNLNKTKKEYKCKYCEKEYKTTRGLQSHMSAHCDLITGQIPGPDSSQPSLPGCSYTSKSTVSQQSAQNVGELNYVQKPVYESTTIKLEQSQSVEYASEDYLDYNKRLMRNQQQQNSSNVLHKKFYDCSMPSYSHMYSMTSLVVKTEHPTVSSGGWHEVDSAPKQYWVDSKGMPGYRQPEDLQQNKVYADTSPRNYEELVHMQRIQYYQQLHNATTNCNAFVAGRGAGFGEAFMGVPEDVPYSHANMECQEETEGHSYLKY